MGVLDLPGLSDLSDLFGDGADTGSANYQAILDAWKKLQGQANVAYQTPDNTFAQQSGVLDQLQQQSQTGLTDQDKFAFWQARQQAGDLANQRQGAIQQQAQMQGGGVANGGQNAVLQAQAAQMGANRLSDADMGQAAAASQRRYQATRDYMTGLQGLGNQQFRNTQALNDFNQRNFGNNYAATGGLSGAYQMQANDQSRAQEQRRQAGQNLGNMFLPLFGKKKMPWDSSGGGAADAASAGGYDAASIGTMGGI